mgnify:CR=1 FL=1
MKTKIKINPVVVEWIDSCSTHGWVYNPKPASLECVTVGHLISKTKDKVTVCLCLSDTGSIHTYFEIPTVAVKRIRKLR